MMKSKISAPFVRDIIHPQPLPCRQGKARRGKARQDRTKAKMKKLMTLLRARSLCEWDFEAWWLQGSETSGGAENGGALRSGDSGHNVATDAEFPPQHHGESAGEDNGDQQIMPVTPGRLAPPPGSIEQGSGMFQQSPEDSIPSRGVGDFVILLAVHAPFVVGKVLEKRHDDDGDGE